MTSSLTLNDTEIRIKGIEALNTSLGAANALHFITLIQQERDDYVDISRRLYHGQSVDEIYERARDNWQKEY